MKNFERAILQVKKAIQGNNLTNNEVYEIIVILQRQYMEVLVQDNILKLMNNYKYQWESSTKNTNGKKKGNVPIALKELSPTTNNLDD